MPDDDSPITYCQQPLRNRVPDAPGLTVPHTRAIRVSRKKWVNGTVLHYVFLKRDGEWDWPNAQMDVVYWAFDEWRKVGIGLQFKEVTDESEAEIKIGRKPNNKSWSYVGTELLDNQIDGCTMNYGWDLTTSWGHATALHEIGHSIGFEHEHQNPQSGIVWNEEAVYADFLRDDDWDRDYTYSNVIEKLEPNGAEGSQWDPTSIMEYPFKPGLIISPKPYDTKGIGQNVQLSKSDKDWALYWYPANPRAAPLGLMELTPLNGANGSQFDFHFAPRETRKYEIRTLGKADSRIVLFEEREGEPRHYAAADDAGTPDNARISAKLVARRDYVVRARLHYRNPGAQGGLVIM
jgi:hypothetical protein